MWGLKMYIETDLELNSSFNNHKKTHEIAISNIMDTKPEPIASRPNWNYDSYFLAQLDRVKHIDCPHLAT